MTFTIWQSFTAIFFHILEKSIVPEELGMGTRASVP